MNINYKPYEEYVIKPLKRIPINLDFINFLDPWILESMRLEVMGYKRAKSTFNLGNSFINNPLITSFDEFRFFGVKVIDGPNEFRGSVNLRSIVLPPTVNYISPTAFNGCSNLKFIQILTKGLELDYDAFLGCHRELVLLTPDKGGRVL